MFEERRGFLREMLRQLRLSFARRLHVAPFLIFHDTTLDSIVENMPTTREDLLDCYGMGPKNVASFGRPILEVIAHYRADTSSRVCQGSGVASLITRGHPSDGDGEDEDEDDTFKVGAQLTIYEIVNQRFEEVERSGQIITI